MDTAWEILALVFFWGVYVLAAVGLLIILFAIFVGLLKAIQTLTDKTK